VTGVQTCALPISVRGANITLSSDGSGAEVTDKSDGHLDAFTSDGFTVGAGTFDALVAQIDPSVRQLPDNTDVNMWHYFFKQAGRSLRTM